MMKAPGYPQFYSPLYVDIKINPVFSSQKLKVTAFIYKNIGFVHFFFKISYLAFKHFSLIFYSVTLRYFYLQQRAPLKLLGLMQ